MRQRIVGLDFNDPSLNVPDLGIVNGQVEYITGTRTGLFNEERPGFEINNPLTGFLASDPSGIGGKVDLSQHGEYGVLNSVTVEFDNTDGFYEKLLQANVVINGAVVRIWTVDGSTAYSRYVGLVEESGNSEELFWIQARGASESEHKNIPTGSSTVESFGDLQYLPLGDGQSDTGDADRYFAVDYKEEIIGGEKKARITILQDYWEWVFSPSPNLGFELRNKWISPYGLAGKDNLEGVFIEDQGDLYLYATENADEVWAVDLVLSTPIPELLSEDFSAATPGRLLDAEDNNSPFVYQEPFLVEIRKRNLIFNAPASLDGVEKDDDGNPVLYRYDEGLDKYFKIGSKSTLEGDKIIIPDNSDAVFYETIQAQKGSRFTQGVVEEIGDPFSPNTAGVKIKIRPKVLTISQAQNRRYVELRYVLDPEVDLEQFDELYIAPCFSIAGDILDTSIPQTGNESGFLFTFYEEIESPVKIANTPKDTLSKRLLFPSYHECFVPVYRSDGQRNSMGDALMSFDRLNFTPSVVLSKPPNFPVFMEKDASFEYVGVASDARENNVFPIEKIYNNTIIVHIELDPNMSLNYTSFELNCTYIAVVGSKKISYENVYLKRDNTVEVDNSTIPGFIEYLFDYSGISYQEDVTMSSRSNWEVGALLDKKESTKKVLQQIAKQSFLAIFQDRFGFMTAVAFRDITDNYGVTHDETIVSKIRRVSQTSSSKIYNDINLEYALSTGTGNFTERYYVSNIDAIAFPGEGDDYSAFSNIPSYPDAKLFWESAHQAYIDTSIQRPLKNDVSQCRFYLKSAAVMASSIHFLMVNVIEWCTRPKNTISYTVPMNSDTLRLDYGDLIFFKDNLVTYGQVVRSYVVGLSDAENEINVDVITEPVNLIPVYDIIDEDFDSMDPDLIDEDFTDPDPDQIDEDF